MLNIGRDGEETFLPEKAVFNPFKNVQDYLTKEIRHFKLINTIFAFEIDNPYL